MLFSLTFMDGIASDFLRSDLTEIAVASPKIKINLGDGHAYILHHQARNDLQKKLFFYQPLINLVT
jgi:hypothetical protein